MAERPRITLTVDSVRPDGHREVSTNQGSAVLAVLYMPDAKANAYVSCIGLHVDRIQLVATLLAWAHEQFDESEWDFVDRLVNEISVETIHTGFDPENPKPLDSRRRF